jgi:hypothetical protein
VQAQKGIKNLLHLIYNWNGMTGSKSILSHSPSVVTRKTGDEYVLVPVTNNIADMNSVYTLNETGAFIWEHINGKRNVEDIINAVTTEYNIDNETAKDDVFSFIENMSKYLIIH